MSASHPDSSEILQQMSAHAQRVTGQVRAQREDLAGNRHIDQAHRQEGVAAMDELQNALANLLGDVTQALTQEPKTPHD